MKFERKVVDETKKIVQITTSDERWYQIGDVFVPSVTWITHYYPKGRGFENWLAKNGMDEAEMIKQAAADKGSKVHQAVSDLIDGRVVRHDSKYFNPSTGQPEELTTEEYSALMSFVGWVRETQPRNIKHDVVVYNKEEGYAGTLDWVCEIKIKSARYIVDFKTSQQVYPSHKIQVSAYKHADEEFKDAKLAILQLGYRKAKCGYKFTELDDRFDLFLATKMIWQNECSEIQPLQRDYPTELKIELAV